MHVAFLRIFSFCTGVVHCGVVAFRRHAAYEVPPGIFGQMVGSSMCLVLGATIWILGPPRTVWIVLVLTGVPIVWHGHLPTA